MLASTSLWIWTLSILRLSRYVHSGELRVILTGKTDPHWNHFQFARFQAVLDEFQKFPNTAGVFVGNEVITTKEGSAAAPYVLAAARDMKSYRNEKGYREIPVGYSAADIAELRPMLQNYLACLESPHERLDFYSLNAYEWCGPSSYEVSGYDMLEKNATGYPIPIFFSETGCNTVPPRTFGDQSAIFGPEMSDTWSGAMVYEWIQETNNYGLISYGALPEASATTDPMLVQDGFTRKGSPTPMSPDFTNLKSQWATLSPTGVALSDYKKSTSALQPPACPDSTTRGWTVDAKSPLPTLGQSYSERVQVTTTGTATGAGNSGNSGHSGTSASRPESQHETTTSMHNGANAVSVAGYASTDYLVTMSIMLCSVVGFTALWL